MESNEQNAEPKKSLTVEEVQIDILPVIYEIIRSIERDHHDASAKTRESQDCSQKVLELQKRLDQARVQIKQLSGIEYSKEQQLNHLEALKTQLRLKQELLHKYRLLMTFLSNNERLIQRLSESYPMRRAAQLVVLFFLKGKGLLDDPRLQQKLTPEQFKSFMQTLAQNIKKIKDSDRHFKK